MATVPLDMRSGDELHESIVAGHACMRSAQRRLFADIAEHDRREDWRRMGAVSEENYLTGTLGVSWRTARSWVRAAHTLERYPFVANAFAAGQLSEDQLQALVDIEMANGTNPTLPLGPFDDQGPAPGPSPDPPGESGQGAAEPQPDSTADDKHEQDLLDMANRLSSRQLAAEARRRKRASQEEAVALHRRRHLDISYDEADRRLRIHGGDLFDDQAAALWAALTDYAAGCSADPVSGEFEPLPRRFADGLAELALAHLAGREQATGRAALVVHADARVLAGDDGWADTSGYAPLAAETIRRMACYCELFLVADDPDGHPIGVGRAQRTPPWWLADMVRRRDGHCRFPGCQRRLFVQTHHIAEWEAHLGRTDLGNLVTLCTRHHHSVHEGGWKMGGDPGDEMTFTSPDGTVLTSWPAACTERATSPPGARAAPKRGSPPKAESPPPRRAQRGRRQSAGARQAMLPHVDRRSARDRR